MYSLTVEPPVIFKERSGEESAAQISAFDDTWHWGLEAEETYRDLVSGGGRIADLVEAFRQFLGQNDIMAYLMWVPETMTPSFRIL